MNLFKAFLTGILNFTRGQGTPVNAIQNIAEIVTTLAVAVDKIIDVLDKNDMIDSAQLPAPCGALEHALEDERDVVTVQSSESSSREQDASAAIKQLTDAVNAAQVALSAFQK